MTDILMAASRQQLLFISQFLEAAGRPTMFQLKKAYSTLQIIPPKPDTKRPVSIPLRQLSVRTNSMAGDEMTQRGPALPADIWFMILPQVDYTEDCTLCKHKELLTISLVCRVFNQFAKKALYKTLDLRLEDACLEVHEGALDTSKVGSSFLKESILRNKLDRLERTLRLPEGPVLFIRHLKLPMIELLWGNYNIDNFKQSLCSRQPRNVYNYGKDEPYAHSYINKAVRPLQQRKTDLSLWKNNVPAGILPKWITIFELASSRLESVSGLGSLWTHIYEYEKFTLRERLCDAIEKNPNWTQWDWQWNSWGYYQDHAEAITVEPRLLEIFHGMKNIRSIKFDDENWVARVLKVTSSPIQSLTISSFKTGSCDFNTIFQNLPLEGLQSLRIIGSIECSLENARNDPFTPLIDYLKRCRQISTTPALTTLDIQFDLNLTPPPIFYDPGGPFHFMTPFEEFLSSIFNQVPLLRTFNLVLSTSHEDRIEYPTTQEYTSFTAQNLRTMSISLPARNSKAWLASKIHSNCFPALRRFSFRSAFSRNNGLRGICTTCKYKPWSEVDNWYNFARSQDRLLVEACREANVREWEMEILNLPWADCSCFTLEESLEDDSGSLYFRPPQNITDYDASQLVSGLAGHAGPRKDSAIRRNARIIELYVVNPNIIYLPPANYVPIIKSKSESNQRDCMRYIPSKTRAWLLQTPGIVILDHNGLFIERYDNNLPNIQSAHDAKETCDTILVSKIWGKQND